jgi:hypothetical protein
MSALLLPERVAGATGRWFFRTRRQHQLLQWLGLAALSEGNEADKVTREHVWVRAPEI